MCDVRGIAPVGNVRRKRVRDFAAAFGQRKQHHAAVGGQPASIKRGCDFLARNRWQAKAELAIVGHGGLGSEAGARRVGLQHPFPMRVQRFAPYPSAQNASRLNKMG